MEMYEDHSDRISDEARHRLEMERNAQQMVLLLDQIHAKQMQWEENQKWQINDVRETSNRLLREISFFHLIAIILLGYIAYKIT